MAKQHHQASTPHNNESTTESQDIIKKIDHPFGFYAAITHLALEQKRQREIRRAQN